MHLSRCGDGRDGTVAADLHEAFVDLIWLRQPFPEPALTSLLCFLHRNVAFIKVSSGSIKRQANCH